MLRLGGKIQVFVEVGKICFFLNVIFVARRIISFQLSGMCSQTVRRIFFFSISEANRSRFFSIKDFSFYSFVSPSKTTKDFKCVFGEVRVIPDTER